MAQYEGKEPIPDAVYFSVDNLSLSRSDNMCVCVKASKCVPWAQRLANPNIFTAHMMVATTFGIMTFVYFAGVITTIERYFQLESYQSGSIIMIMEVVSLMFVLPASHYGHRGHRPRWIGAGVILWGIGSIMSSIPHFISDPLDPDRLLTGGGSSNPSEDICAGASINDSNFTRSSDGNETDDHGSSASGGFGNVWWIIIGQIIIGIGEAPIFPLMITYIDDAVPSHKITTYTAILFTSMTIGPPIAFLLSAYTTSLYIDFNRVAPDLIPQISQNDPRWIGAWWLGFVVLGIILIILGIPILFYPKNLPSSVELKREKEMQQKGERNSLQNDMKEESAAETSVRERRGSIHGYIDREVITSTIKGPLLSLKRLLTNVTNMSLTMASSAFMAIIAVYGSFGLKYTQTQYALSPSHAAFVSALILGPGSIIGQIVSAYICRRYKLNMKQCSLFIIIGTVISLVLYPLSMSFGCDNPPIAGVTVPYDDSDSRNFTIGGNVSSQCNIGCGCSDEVFQPVCGSNGLTYISPCHAGCHVIDESSEIGENELTSQFNYSDCRCISSDETFSPDIHTMTTLPSDSRQPDNYAVSGQCGIWCTNLPFWLIVEVINMFMEVMTENPSIYVSLRCVREEDRSLAVGLRSVFGKVLGFFPTPIYVGAIIDSVCILWQTTDGDRGACWIYDNTRYRHALYSLAIGLQFLATFFYILMYVSIKEKLRPKKTEDAVSNSTEKCESHEDSAT